MRRLIGLLVVTFGCSGAATSSPTGDSAAKLRAAQDHARGTSNGDVCSTQGWYGDGECDTFCTNTDTDCVPHAGGGSGEPIVCAAFSEVSDGVCKRPATDACRSQDPDCDAPEGVCALISEVPNGSCTRPSNDACRFQDPDCNTQPGVIDCDTAQLRCQTFAAVICPDGQVPTVVNGCYGPCVDKSQCDGNSGTVNCDGSQITCQTFAPVTCPEGQIPSVVDHCYGPCVPVDQCEPVACLAYVEEPDGVCSRNPTDPCKSQDPDCKP